MPARRRAFYFRTVTMKESNMTITVTLPSDVLTEIDRLRELETLSRSTWLRREVVQAIRTVVADRRRSPVSTESVQ
jgi:metal-responsive CopG/Arc/MetJ family transcriptional regulator